MASLIGSCCGSLIATCGCSAVKACLPSSKKSAKVFYVGLMSFAVLLALLLRWWGKPLLINLWITDIKFCDSARCYGFGAILRISFSLFLFYCAHALTAAFKGNPDNMNFLLKLISWILLLVLVFLIPDDFYNVYAQICRFAGGVFLLLQIAVLVDSFCLWQESWMEKELRKPILGVSIFSYLGSLTALVLLFHYFGGEGCGTSNLIISFCLVSTLVFTVLSVTDLSRHGVMPASLVTLYCYWLVFTALSSDPSECNTVKSDNPAQLIVGGVLAAFSVGYAAFSVSDGVTDRSGKARHGGDGDDDDDDLVVKDEETVDADLEDGGKRRKKKAFTVVHGSVDSEDYPSENGGEGEDFDPSRELKFHILLALAAMYMAMLLTNWATPRDAGRNDYSIGKESMWVKTVTQWVTALVYTWTFIAPVVLRNRTWD